MLELLKKLCLADGTSGDEVAVRDIIISEIEGKCEYEIDPLGNILVYKTGKKRAKKRVMLDAHTDEVGLIISSITADGFLKFQTVGGMEAEALIGKTVRINRELSGVICIKPIHLSRGDEAKEMPKVSALCIDIGAESREDAESYVTLGDRAVVISDYIETEDKILSKALDDRIGCAVLVELIKAESEYDFCASFSFGEEIGLKGAKTAAFTLEPDAAIILEGTTAADVAGVDAENRVCVLGKGAAVSFMDRSTVYDREYYNAALNSGVLCQPKAAVAGGNNAGAVHLNRGGVRTIAISAPCRYIHSASSVADKRDINAVKALAEYMLRFIAGGEEA